MDRLDALRIFVRVVESDSFSAVAREEGLGQPAVSKSIAALEEHLGAQLLRRTSRSLSVTEAGLEFYESAVRILEELDAAESRVGRGQTTPSGTLRVAVAPFFGRFYIVPRLKEFFALYPAIDLELIVTDRNVNLVEEGLDIAIQHGELEDSSSIVRRFASTRIVTVATPAYLHAHGVPESLADLEKHSCIIFAPLRVPRVWGFEVEGSRVVHHPKGCLRTADAEAIRAAVLADLGLAHTPGWLFSREIASGEVVAVLSEQEPERLAISLIHPAGRRLATKVRVFVDFLSNAFSEEPW